jgi:hypothetical protein
LLAIELLIELMFSNISAFRLLNPRSALCDLLRQTSINAQ